jgi:hypothetical protein
VEKKNYLFFRRGFFGCLAGWEAAGAAAGTAVWGRVTGWAAGADFTAGADSTAGLMT